MKGRPLLCLLITPLFERGDQAPAGYLARAEWARVQYEAGLRQKQCVVCQKWRFPQEACCETGPLEDSIRAGK